MLYMVECWGGGGRKETDPSSHFGPKPATCVGGRGGGGRERERLAPRPTFAQKLPQQQKKSADSWLLLARHTSSFISVTHTTNQVYFNESYERSGKPRSHPIPDETGEKPSTLGWALMTMRAREKVNIKLLPDTS